MKTYICQLERLEKIPLLSVMGSLSIKLNLYLLAVITLLVVSKYQMIASVKLQLIHPDRIPSSSTFVENVKRLMVSENDGFDTRLKYDRYGFLVSFSIGEPAILEVALIDTGSHLFYIPCQNCKKCRYLYDSSKSSTYENVSCPSPYCVGCKPKGVCSYDQSFKDGASTGGTIGKESFEFPTLDDDSISINLVFGCSNTMEGQGMDHGIMGLGAGVQSIVTQLSSQFSHCLGPIRDTHYKYNHLIIGENAVLRGDSTPIVSLDGGHYFVTLQGISVGGKKLAIKSANFKRNHPYRGGVVLDTGSPYSRIIKSAYKPLLEELMLWAKRNYKHVGPHPERSDLCILDRISEVRNFPNVTFHFAGGTDFVVGVHRMFIEFTDNLFCLAALGIPEREINIIGLWTMQNYNIGYDVEDRTVYFEEIDCQLLV